MGNASRNAAHFVLFHRLQLERDQYCNVVKASSYNVLIFHVSTAGPGDYSHALLGVSRTLCTSHLIRLSTSHGQLHH